MHNLIKRIEGIIKVMPEKGVHNKACIETYRHVLSIINNSHKPKVFESLGCFGVLFVCALNSEHAKDIIAKDLGKKKSEFIFFSFKEIPEELYTSFTMEREGEEGLEFLNFHQYMKKIRGHEDCQVFSRVDEI